MSRCGLCFRRCELSEGQKGFCRARSCKGGRIVSDGYGRITSLALDPVEKKPLWRFRPGSLILSIGGYGCNLRCPFCQNHFISMTDGRTLPQRQASPAALADLAAQLVPRGNIGLAYTYNEPTVAFEYVLDCAREVRARGLSNVLVTNGSLLEEPLEELLPLIDAMNIDLKGFSEGYYRWLGGDLETVKRFIVRSVEYGCHVELTTLVVPGKNDSAEEMLNMARWVAALGTEIPLHISRYFPCYNTPGIPATPVEKIVELVSVAQKCLKYVYKGNC